MGLVVWGSHLPSSIGIGRITKQLSDMLKIPAYYLGVFTGVLLSDGYIQLQKGRLNARFGFGQSIVHFGYFWFVFNYLSPYTNSLPYISFH